MKKIITLIVAAAVLLSAALTLTSCFHKCEFSEEWTANGDSHWHVCTNDRCEETADLADHIWDEGKVTSKATQESDGVRTFTCTVCGHTKNEAIIFTGYDEEEWNAALADALYTNFTYVETGVVKATGMEITTVATYKIADGKMYTSTEIAGQKTENTFDGTNAELSRKNLINSLTAMLKYGEFEYDAANKIYKLTGKMTLSSLNTDAKSGSVKFENGKLKEITYACNMVSSGINMETNSTIVFSDYGTTVIG